MSSSVGFTPTKLYNVFTGMIKLGAMFNFPKVMFGNQIRADLALQIRADLKYQRLAADKNLSNYFVF